MTDYSYKKPSLKAKSGAESVRSNNANVFESGIRERLLTLKGDLADSAFAQKCMIAGSTMRKYLAGSMPGADKLVQIAQRNGVSIEWLATGQGSPDLGVSEASAPYTLGTPDDFALVPLYDVTASAGHGAAAEDSQPLRELAFRRDWLVSHGLHVKDLAVIEVKGDSMNPTLTAGDTILLDMSDTKIGADAIYVLRMNDHLYAKRLQRSLDGSVRVISDNPAYKDQVVAENDLRDLRVTGRVVWAGRFFV